MLDDKYHLTYFFFLRKLGQKANIKLNFLNGYENDDKKNDRYAKGKSEGESYANSE